MSISFVCVCLKTMIVLHVFSQQQKREQVGITRVHDDFYPMEICHYGSCEQEMKTMPKMLQQIF